VSILYISVDTLFYINHPLYHRPFSPLTAVTKACDTRSQPPCPAIRT